MAQIETNDLAAATVQTVTFTGGRAAYFLVWHHGAIGTPAIFVRTDGVNPTVDGDDCAVVLPGDQPTRLPAGASDAPTLKLISSAIVKYSCQRVT